MSDDKDRKDKHGEWSAGAKVGAAVGSAALMAALLYTGRRHLSHRKGRLEPLSPEPEAVPLTETLPKTETD